MNVFVYGANLQGIHGAGAALHAKKHYGAVDGFWGLRGKSYGIPTKRTPWKSLELPEVAYYVSLFIGHARMNPDDEFRVTPIGCGLAGFTPEQIAPMFRDAPSNVVLPHEFLAVLEKS